MSGRKFCGTLDQLPAIVEATRIAGRWRDLPNRHHHFGTVDGGVMNWWSSTRTIYFQSSPGAVRSLQQALAEVMVLEGQGPLPKALPDLRD